MNNNLQFPKIESLTDKEHQILQSIIKKKEKIVVHTKEQMEVYKKFIKHVTLNID